MLQNKINKNLLVLLIIAVIFFFIYSFLSFGNSGNHFTWPDETANYFFVKNYISQSSFRASEPLNSIAGDLLKPRSFNVLETDLVPGSFLGLLLIYGLIGKIIGLGLIKFLTPFLAAIAGIFFYKLLLKIFKPEIAFFSAILFYLNPAWWYYANFSLLPNIAFISLLLIGFYFLLGLAEEKLKKHWLNLVLGSFLIALALTIRTNEAVWVLGVVLFLALVYRQKIKWQEVLIFIAVNFLVFIPIFYYNQATYGNYLSFGYLRLGQGTNLSSQLPTEFSSGQQSAVVTWLKFIFLPFGLHPRNIITVLNNYLWSLCWWLFVPAIWGIFLFIKKYQQLNKAVYLMVSFVVTLFLLVYYGSWIFEDKMTLQLNRLGISYVRYLLPIYILALPYCALVFQEIISWFKAGKIKIILGLAFLGSWLTLSLQLLYFSGYDNLRAIKQNIGDYNQINAKVLELTEPDAVIISQRSDKIFFPERRVISKWGKLDYGYWINLLSDCVPLYYYSFEGPDYMSEFWDNIAFFYGLKLGPEIKITDSESLYKIEFIKYGH